MADPIAPNLDSPSRPEAAGWMRLTLALAGVYNLLWGAVVVIAPVWVFELFGVQEPDFPALNYPQLWQCVGMIVGVYGVGYLVAARDPLRHWPIVLVGFLGKVFGPIGFAGAVVDGVFPITFGVNIIFNDLIWWLPFGAILLQARRRAVHDAQNRQTPMGGMA